MTRRAVARTATAESDIREIFAFIGSNSRKSAQKFNDDLAATLERLREFPHSGYKVAGYNRPLLAVRASSRFRRYIVIYRLPDDDSLVLMRVLYGARHIASLIADMR